MKRPHNVQFHQFDTLERVKLHREWKDPSCQWFGGGGEERTGQALGIFEEGKLFWVILLLFCNDGYVTLWSCQNA